MFQYIFRKTGESERKKGNSQLFPTIFAFGLIIIFSSMTFAASTGTTSLLRQIGSGAPYTFGDYISSTQGLNTYYRYFIEVPPGLTRFRVELFDADVGRGNNQTRRHDWLSGSWNTSCLYTLYNPIGTSMGTITGSASAGTNDGWMDLYNVTSGTIPAGHWELRVDMTSAVTSGDDCNGYGIHTTGGNVSGNVEINTYAYSYIPVGTLTGTTSTTLFPYITSGCSADWNEWDGDNAPPTYLCSYSYRSRTTNTSGSFYGSGVTLWNNTPITNFDDTNLLSSDSGIWSTTAAYTDTGAGGNFGILYIGNSSAGDPPPAGQPAADTFRIYLPTDAGGAPAKPFLTQRISHLGGPNPPALGSTTRVRVEIVMFNLSGQTITFSGSNLVTANIPGAGVVYAGGALVSQGTIVSQPVVGGTGNITWNPGAVTGNDNYVTLYYQVDITPTEAGQRLPVTGVGTNGTTARFVDETGNTTQAMATMNYGPLCELAATEGGGDIIPTLVSVSSFDAFMENGQAAVQWTTASQIGTSGFSLWRKDQESAEFHQLYPSFLSAFSHFPQGGVYRLTDRNAQYGKFYEYKLVEIETNGNSITYGPFPVTIHDQNRDSSSQPNPWKKTITPISTRTSGYQRWAHDLSQTERNRLQAKDIESQRKKNFQTFSDSENGGKAKIIIKNEGLYYLNATQIAQAMRIPVAQAEARINSNNLQLSNKGQLVTWFADSNRLGIYFFAEPLRSVYSDENVYWLAYGKNASAETIDGGAPAAVNARQTFLETIHAEEDHYALAAMFTDPRSDIWLWDYVGYDQPSSLFKIHTPGVALNGTATLTVYVKGMTTTLDKSKHYAQVSVNNTVIGRNSWQGLDRYSFSLQFNQSLLRDGINNVKIEGPESNDNEDMYYVDTFDLAYQRYYQASENRLICNGSDHAIITIESIMDPLSMVLDVTTPRNPKLITRTSYDPSFRLSFIPPNPKNRFLVYSLSAALSPLSITSAASPNLKNSSNSAEYIVITPAILKETARELADFHQRQGLATMVVALEDIYNEFNYGISDPWAIKDFLGFAYQNWSGKKPRYVVLVGNGTYDYKNCRSYGDNLMPPVLANTPNGLFAADNEFGDVSGNDGIPEIAIGRLPVVTESELRAWIEKIKSYDKASGPWTKKAVLIADNADSGGNFPQNSDDLATQIGLPTIERLYINKKDSTFDANRFRQQVIDAFNAGALFVNYIGHGGLDQLTFENIFNNTDLAFLNNETKLPVVFLLSCVVGRFEIPGNDTLSENLLIKEKGGAIAVIAPSGASPNLHAVLLGEEFYKAIFRDNERDLGAIWLKATKNYAAAGGDKYLLSIYNILGDPALIIK